MKKLYLPLFVILATAMLGAFTNIKLISVTLSNSAIDTSSVAATTFQVSTGLTNSTGMQSVSGTSCTTAASANAACSTTVTWPVTWADSAYHASCQIKDQQSGGAMFVSGSGTRTTTTLVLQLQNAAGNSNASSYTYECLGWH